MDHVHGPPPIELPVGDEPRRGHGPHRVGLGVEQHPDLEDPHDGFDERDLLGLVPQRELMELR
jgi:hypothetical protein